MIRLYILLCLLPCLLLTAPFTHAALLPRLKVPFKLPGAVFNEPEIRSLNVVPFKELPGQSHHGHRLHHTLSLVKRLVEDQGDMVEVTEEALQELLDQINKLHDQVNGMMPSGSSDRQPSRETSASSSGQSGQLPAGFSDGSSGNGQPEQLPEQSSDAKVPISANISGPSEAPVVSEPSLRSELPAPTDEATAVREPQSLNAPDLPNVSEQSQTEGLDRQADSVLVVSAGNPTQAVDNESANSPSEAEPEEDPGDDTAVVLTKSADVVGNEETLQTDVLPNNAVTQPTGEAQAPAEARVSAAQDARPTEEPQDEGSSPASGSSNTGAPSSLPGGGFVESPDDVLQTLSNDVTSAEETGIPMPQETQESLSGDDECVEDEEVSGISVKNRNPNCTPGDRSSPSDPMQDASAFLSLVATTETSLARVDATASGLVSMDPTTGDSPAATKVEGPAPALETEATSTPTIKAADSQQLGAPTAAQLSAAPTSPSLRTLVFTSVLTRSSTIKLTTTRTETVDVNEPTGSLKPPGHVFKEDADAGAAFNRDGKLAVEDNDDKDTSGIKPSGEDKKQMLNTFAETPLEEFFSTEIMPETISLRTTTMAMTTTISLSYRSTMATPEATREFLPSSLVSPGIGSGNGTYDATPASGFKIMPRSRASLVERAQI
ncbi:hypothetical protein FLONG3_174 [Fusarium longipes]|uniref:Uncharacterized protein n=1 Tax=Fusarium longipes TaxID=694270 RepID=A0A395TAZ0_9HYPO|nr:hypothetical protein FLONG3_174 [Fusarium longipes]